jgi:hypothetical protein
MRGNFYPGACVFVNRDFRVNESCYESAAEM